ncbi:hypothetical protein ACSFA8_09045 [Variovorax sp. RT4R15]|uniref:hypothetical protein n=1 Tax=Variovorax sp. RT4R15 TaxID=3443737 RepID=UPI003F469FCC
MILLALNVMDAPRATRFSVFSVKLFARTNAKDAQPSADLEREFKALSSRLPLGPNFERHMPEAVEPRCTGPQGRQGRQGRQGAHADTTMTWGSFSPHINFRECIYAINNKQQNTSKFSRIFIYHVELYSSHRKRTIRSTFLQPHRISIGSEGQYSIWCDLEAGEHKGLLDKPHNQ